VQAKPTPPAEAPKPATNNNGLFDLDFSSSATTNANKAVAAANARKNNADILSLFGSAPAMASPPVQAATVSSGLDAFASLNLGGPSSSSTSSFSGFGQQTSYQQPAPVSTTNYTTASANPNMYVSSSSTGPSATSSYSHRPASNSISGANPWATPAAPVPAPAQAQAGSSNNFFSSPPAQSAPSAAPPSYSYNQSSNSTTSNSNNYASPPAAASHSSGSMDFFNSQDIWGSSAASSSNARTSTDGGFGGFSSGTTTGKSGGFDDLWG